MYSEINFFKAIEQSFRAYKEHGARSTAKLKPIHRFIAETLKELWGNEFDVYYLDDNNREMTVEGKYYPKDIDITVVKNGKAVFCLGIKFVTSNYKQNANNYFENMMGETANIQAIGNLPYAQLLILRHQTPYYLKNETETPSKIEVINDKDITKYLKLMFDVRQAHRPDYLAVQLIDIDELTGKISKNSLTDFSEEIADLLNTKFSPTNFFNEIAAYKTFLTSIK